MTFWPWWLGAFSLTTLALSYWWVTGRPLGVSSVWEALVRWREEGAVRRSEAAFTEQADLEAALLAATKAAFGDEAPVEEDSVESAATEPVPYLHLPRPPLSLHVVFLFSFFVGGLLAAMVRGGWRLQSSLGPDFERLLGSGPGAWFVLVLGGMLIGFGTRLGGGCTSGHGINGCSRLQPGSLVSTAAFFGTAVVVSFLLEAIVR